MVCSGIAQSVAKQCQQAKGQQYHHSRETQQRKPSFAYVWKPIFPVQTLLKCSALCVPVTEVSITRLWTVTLHTDNGLDPMLLWNTVVPPQIYTTEALPSAFTQFITLSVCKTSDKQSVWCIASVLTEELCKGTYFNVVVFPQWAQLWQGFSLGICVPKPSRNVSEE